MAEVPLECRGYVRFPTSAAGRIAFVAEDDLWVVDRSGGRPRRLTNLDGAVRYPLFCPLGERIAFTVGSDIWMLSLREVRPRRLTWFPGGEARPIAWSEPSGGTAELVVSSDGCDPYARDRLFTVALAGGQPKVLYEGEYDWLVREPGGHGIGLCRHTFDPVSDWKWKGYRGGRHGIVWLDLSGDGSSFSRLRFLDSGLDSGEERELNVSCVMWLKDRLWFVADPDGSGNLWSTNLNGEDLTKHTDHDVFDVRHATASPDGDVVVYSFGGELWALDPAGGRAERLELDFGWPSSHMPQFLDAEEHCEDVLLHPDGHRFACLTRGQAFELALWSGPPTPMRAPPSTAERVTPSRAVRCVAMEYLFSGRLVTITDELAPLPSFVIHPATKEVGEPRPQRTQDLISLLMAESGEGAQRVAPPAKPIGRIAEIIASPAHDALLIVTGRNELLLVEFVPEIGERPDPQKEPTAKLDLPLRLEVKVLDRGEWEEGVSEPCWSSDGEWVAYVRKDSRRGSSIILLHLETGEKTVVADSSFSNFTPCFDAAGHYLSFFSSRTFAPLEDDITTDLSFPTGSDLPYLVLLQKDAENPFKRPALSPAEMRDREEADGEDDEEDEEDGSEGGSQDEGAEQERYEPPEKVTIDIEGLSERILQFPLPFGKYSCGSWTMCGKFQFLRGVSIARQPQADGCEEEAEETSALFAFNFTRLKEAKLSDNVQDYHLSMDLRNMLVTILEQGSDEEEYYVVAVAGSPLPGQNDDEDESLDLDNPGPESGILDISSRISLEVVPVEEWAQIFEEICAHVIEEFFDEDLGGLDWDGICRRYRSVLPKLRSRSELTDLLAELLSEVGVSHSTVGGPDDERDDQEQLTGTQGSLGVEVSWQEISGVGAYRVDHVVKGDVWDKQYSGPLGRPCVGLKEGSFIIAVNRARVRKEVSLEQMLTDFGGTQVYVTFVPPDGAQSFVQTETLLQKHGGMDGFRRLNVQQRKALQVQCNGRESRRSKKKNKKAKQGKHSQAEMEQKISEAIDSLGFRSFDWRTVQVSATSGSRYRSAALRDLVEARLRHVHEASGGRVGYIHVPDTCELGFAEFYRYFGRECDREALICDLRCNEGGFATELFMKQLQSKPLGWSVPRQGRGRHPVCPDLCVQGSLVLLIDENTYSDGEAWAQSFKNQGLGKVVGVRTCGGVCEMGGADLDTVDGGWVSIPYMHYYMQGTGFGLENHGAEPDIVVECPPLPPARGGDGASLGVAEDPQLKEAIRQAELLLDVRPKRPELPTSFPATRAHRQVPRRQVVGFPSSFDAADSCAAGEPSSQ